MPLDALPSRVVAAVRLPFEYHSKSLFIMAVGSSLRNWHGLSRAHVAEEPNHDTEPWRSNTAIATAQIMQDHRILAMDRQSINTLKLDQHVNEGGCCCPVVTSMI